ncbi:PrsW family glutamic-type intramembrane protease [Streptomyces sp. NPDC048604]|uniref:PrsW family glutamic-type intramembrane protease n=1 Tax=Streptomyces sp. NPDC048604 TaxID=3365578 RepID=UPI00371494E5
MFALSWPTRTVRLSTVLLAVVVGVYGCGAATALIQLAYTRLYANASGQSLMQVAETTSYTVGPWVEELVKASPLLLAGLALKVRRQWALSDFVVLGGALGAGFGLLESLLRYGLDADRALVHDAGGWVVPDSLFPPYVPGPSQVLTAWFPAPSEQIDFIGETAAGTFSHLVWTAVAGLGVGLLWRARGWVRLLGTLPIAAASVHHAVGNYAAQNPGEPASSWRETLDAHAWAAPLACLAIAMVVDLRRLHRGKRAVPDALLASERTDGDTLAALVRYAAWCLPWSLLIALRYVRLRRSLLYAVAAGKPGENEQLHRAVEDITALIEASDHEHAWQRGQIRARLKAARAGATRRKWLPIVPCLLMLPSLLFLGVGSFTSTAALQEYFRTGAGPKILMGFGIAALAWIAWQLTALLRTWRTTAAQPLAEPLAVHRFRLGTALGAAATGAFLLHRGLGEAGPGGAALSTNHLLDALDTFLVYLGFALLLLSLVALFPPGLALAGVGTVGAAITAEAALNAALLGTAGIVLMAAGGSGKGELPPEVLANFIRGNNFNKQNRPRYPHNEIYLENGKYLDSYRPGLEIVSRKHTQIAEVQEASFKKVLSEIHLKYKRGTIIPDTAKSRREYPKLIGEPLEGKYILEVPVQTNPVPEWALKAAAERGVTIRDVTGFVHRLPKG